MLQMLKRLPELGTLSDTLGNSLTLSRTCFDGTDWDFTITAGGMLGGELITEGIVTCCDGVMSATLNGTEVALDWDGDTDAIVGKGEFNGQTLVVAI